MVLSSNTNLTSIKTVRLHLWKMDWISSPTPMLFLTTESPPRELCLSWGITSQTKSCSALSLDNGETLGNEVIKNQSHSLNFPQLWLVCLKSFGPVGGSSPPRRTQVPFLLGDPLEDCNADQLGWGRARQASICQKRHTILPNDKDPGESQSRIGLTHPSHYFLPKGSLKGHLIHTFLVHFPLTHQNKGLKDCFDL